MSAIPLTLFQQHVLKWKDCRRCHLCEKRQRVVFARGDVPCQVLFIGEAPGESEDCLGQPFVGPAGHRMQYIVDQALLGEWTYCLTNIVCCIPRGGDGKKSGAPDWESIEACAPRLRQFVKICDPVMIVCVGGLARDALDSKLRGGIKFHKPLSYTAPHPEGAIACFDIIHPSFIQRALVAQRGLMTQRCIVKIQQALDELTMKPEEVEGA